MSMNLNCKQINLWQTPTYITDMCYSNEDGGWKGILFRYKRWVYSHQEGAMSTEDRLHWVSVIESHFKEIDEVLKKHKRLNFYVM